jgi:hypothetical protein
MPHCISVLYFTAKHIEELPHDRMTKLTLGFRSI